MADSAKTELRAFFDNDVDDVNKKVNDTVSEFEKMDLPYKSCFDEFVDKIASEILDYLLNIDINPETFEDLFCLSSYESSTFPNIQEQNVQNIKYRDSEKNTIALVQIDRNNNKIRLQSFGNVFPKQRYEKPLKIVSKIDKFISTENIEIEDGGINQFDGNIETRYKDIFGNVRAAVIMKPDKKKIDTVVLYQYSNGKKYKMIHSDQYNLSVTIYNIETDSTFMTIDIDTDGNIYGITVNFNN